ncbi:MAG: transketolase [Candidatus Omnitrophota bacterium]
MPAQKIDINSMKKMALTMRREVLEVISRARCGHPGGALSAVEIFISLYGYKMRHRPQQPEWEDRDRLIVSKGHASAITYVALANYGYFPKEDLAGYRTYGSPLQGHVHFGVPGVEFNTGSLGHGLSVANGLALGAKMKNKDMNVFCLMGDGEIQEGSVWEAVMTSAHYRLDNVCAIVDYNKIQENGLTNEIKNLEPLTSKWDSFGWQTLEVDGHDLHELMSALDTFDTTESKPTVIIAHTVKGKGVPFMEMQSKWHGKAPKPDELKDALAALEEAGSDLR